MMKFQEKFDADKLSYIINNKQKFKLNKTKDSKARIDYLRVIFGQSYDPLKMAEKYLSESRGGEITVQYKQTANKGRYHAVRGLSMQGMAIEIRHTITQGLYKDIDIKNAHPVILQWVCEQKKIKCKKLTHYINNRDECLAKVHKNRDFAKQVVLAMLNGGKKLYKELTAKPEWLVELKNEIKAIHEKLAEEKEFKQHKTKREKQGLTFNHEGSYMNVKLCQIENDILMCIYNEIYERLCNNNSDPQNAVLCFDGLMVELGVDVDLTKLQDAVAEKLGINIQLVEKPMNLGFNLPEDIPRYIDYAMPNTFDYSNNCDYQQFQNEFKEMVFDTYEELHDTLHKRYPSVINKVLDGKGSYVKKKHDRCDVIDSLKESDFYMYYTERDASGSGDALKKKLKMSEYLTKQNSLGQYDCKIFNPNPKNFNLWTGFQGKRTDEKGNVDMVKQFLLETWASGNEEYYTYIISWLKGLLVNDMNRVALCMISKPGTGKGWFLNFMRLLLRPSNIAEVCGVQPVIQKHNTIIQNKRLVVINEMSSTREEFRANFDKIKMNITDPKLTVEPKGVNPYEIDNIGNYILFSNHRDSIICEQCDRRYAIFEVADTYINNTKYFEKLTKQCYNQKTADAFFTYLLDFEAVEIREIISTDIREEVIGMSKPAVVKFIDYLKENPLTIPSGEEKLTEIKATDLYQHFREWCGDNGERNVPTSTKFGMLAKDQLVKTRKKNGYVYILP
jgi:hypothetical protein